MWPFWQDGGGDKSNAIVLKQYDDDNNLRQHQQQKNPKENHVACHFYHDNNDNDDVLDCHGLRHLLLDDNSSLSSSSGGSSSNSSNYKPDSAVIAHHHQYSSTMSSCSYLSWWNPSSFFWLTPSSATVTTTPTDFLLALFTTGLYQITLFGYTQWFILATTSDDTIYTQNRVDMEKMHLSHRLSVPKMESTRCGDTDDDDISIISSIVDENDYCIDRTSYSDTIDSVDGLTGVTRTTEQSVLVVDPLLGDLDLDLDGHYEDDLHLVDITTTATTVYVNDVVGASDSVGSKESSDVSDVPTVDSPKGIIDEFENQIMLSSSSSPSSSQSMGGYQSQCYDENVTFVQSNAVAVETVHSSINSETVSSTTEDIDTRDIGIDVASHIYGGTKTVWGWSKDHVPLAGVFLGVTEGVANAVVKRVTKGDLTQIDQDHIQRHLKGVDDKFLNPALHTIVNAVIDKSNKMQTQDHKKNLFQNVVVAPLVCPAAGFLQDHVVTATNTPRRSSPSPLPMS